jgi:arginyl-tRNA synthetase
MDIHFNFIYLIQQALIQAAQALGESWKAFEPEVRPAAATFGDYQTSSILTYAKQLKLNPRSLAEQLLEQLATQPLFVTQAIATSLSGPGFINFKLSDELLLKWLKDYNPATALPASSQTVYKDKTIIVDYVSPNIAKQMHVGHLRTIVIGESLQRLLRFAGAHVVRWNHLGDWGTAFGILIQIIKETHYDLDAPHPQKLIELEALYKKGTERATEEPAFKEKARQELVELQRGNPENKAMWQKITHISNEAFQEIYDQFGIGFDCILGESFYCDQVERVCSELKDLGIAAENQGALVVFHPEHPRFNTQPFIIRKSDEGTNYATTDLASTLYRVEKFKADILIYLTDGRQQDHFEQLTLTVQKWFQQKNYPYPQMRHAWFGTVLGKEGKAIKTRAGESVKLKDLISEAIKRAGEILELKNPNLPQNEKNIIARTVGIAALRYADLSQNRTSDYIFDWDKILSFEGNTAPYLLYAVARIYSLFRKLNASPDQSTYDPSPFETDTERALARKLIQFPSTFELTLEDLRPHILCTYLFELASTFSSFYNANKVITEEGQAQGCRLMLCARTLRTLETGLQLLGIPTLRQM